MTNSVRRAGVVTLCLVALLSCAVYIYKSHQRLSPRSLIELTQDDLAATTAAANKGDAGAAAKLSRHFLIKKQYKLAYTWMLRAKRLGDPGAESDLNEMRKFLPPGATTASDVDDQSKEKEK